MRIDSLKDQTVRIINELTQAVGLFLLRALLTTVALGALAAAVAAPLYVMTQRMPLPGNRILIAFVAFVGFISLVLLASCCVRRLNAGGHHIPETRQQLRLGISSSTSSEHRISRPPSPQSALWGFVAAIIGLQGIIITFFIKNQTTNPFLSKLAFFVLSCTIFAGGLLWTVFVLFKRRSRNAVGHGEDRSP